MKRHIKIALVYAVLAMVCGVFYREFTKAYDFAGVTSLGKVHTHLFMLGMTVFLLFALFDAKLNLQKSKLYLPFLIIYNAGVGLAGIMMIVRGVLQVTAASLSAGANGAVSGVSGIGHVLTAAGIILFFCMLLFALRTDKSAAQERAESEKTED